MVFYSISYLKAYEVRSSVDVSLNEKSDLLTKYPILVNYLIKVWFIYENFISVARNVFAHPNYSVDGIGEGQTVFLQNFQPIAVDDFSSISETGLYRYLYDAYALQNFRKLDLGKDKNGAAITYSQTNVNRIVSASNDLLQNLENYNPFVQKLFYKMSVEESTFIRLVIDYLNCFLETRKISETDIQKAIDTEIIKSQVLEIYEKRYSHTIDITQLENIVLELADYSMYWIFRLKELLSESDINQQFLGLTVFFFIKETNNKLLIQLANLVLCPLDSNIFQLYV